MEWRQCIYINKSDIRYHLTMMVDDGFGFVSSKWAGHFGSEPCVANSFRLILEF